MRAEGAPSQTTAVGFGSLGHLVGPQSTTAIGAFALNLGASAQVPSQRSALQPWADKALPSGGLPTLRWAIRPASTSTEGPTARS